MSFRILSLALAFAGLATPISAQTPDYVGSDACADCHTAATEAWAGSHHAKAWTVPDPENVLADFDGTEFAHDGAVTRFRIEDGEYHAEITEADGETRDYAVHSVVGIEPLQQYLFETEPGRLQSFDVVWDTEQKRWYHLYPDQNLPPEDGLHWTGPYKNWNGRCAECHATGFRKNYDLGTRSFASTQAEIGVGCEACHGPGSAHLDWAKNGTAPEAGGGLDTYGLSMTFGESAGADIEQCAGCHSRRQAFGEGNPVPGTSYHDAYGLAVLRPGLYHADGQILDEVYVYGSFLQSKMYARGVACGNCHDPHSATLVAEGNAVCTQCHSTQGNPEFPTLRRAEYDAPEHHFHTPGSDGAQCKSCHMIERVYMGVDGRRDHSFRVPRPDLAGETNGPDACTDCHGDRDPAWAAERIAERFPDSAHRGPHYGQTLARGRNRPDRYRGALWTLAKDQETPDIVRATALFLMEGAADATVAERIAPLLSDPNPIIRVQAARMQRFAEPADRVSRLEPLLSDPARTVRIAAARELVALPRRGLPPDLARALDRATGNWQASLRANLDFPETHLAMGGMALALRNAPAAEQAFREVVTLDPQRTDAWTMLIRIASATRGTQAAKQVLYEALRHLPSDPVLQELASQL